MFSFHQPSDAQIGDYLARQAGQPFSYNFVGCTREQPVAARGWKIDHHRVLLGHGPEVFTRGRAAIDTWEMFPSKIAKVFGHDVPRENLPVAVLYRVSFFPLWLLMPARVVHTIHDTITRGGHTINRYGFAYGTLPDHPERGEERFLIEWNRSDDTVHYDLLAISQPRHFLARAGYPYTRHEQSRFRHLSGLAMQRALK
jgi:uncharacterized protein (UPF0548 family)